MSRKVKPYLIHPGTTIAAIVAYLREQPPGTALRGSEISERFHVESNNVFNRVAPATNAGVLVSSRNGRDAVYTLGPVAVVEAAPPAEVAR